MNSILLQGLNPDDLRKLIKEILEEKLNPFLKQKESKKTNFLDRFEVAQMLKISLPTLNKWSKSGILQSYRIGNRVLYKLDEIENSVKTVKNLKFKRG